MNRATQQGFTLLEMIMVLATISMLMGLVGPRLFNQVGKAKAQMADIQAKMLKGALPIMRLDIGRLSTEEEGLALLNTPPSDERLGAFWYGPYLESGVPPDPWNRPYLYSDGPSTGQPFTLYSQGADGQSGGKGLDADVSYAPKR